MTRSVVRTIATLLATILTGLAPCLPRGLPIVPVALLPHAVALLILLATLIGAALLAATAALLILLPAPVRAALLCHVAFALGTVLLVTKLVSVLVVHRLSPLGASIRAHARLTGAGRACSATHGN